MSLSVLAFEGGGGKGVTYLGAIRALEELKILPIDISKPGGNQIKGISGASAGAITALFLAMGLKSEQLEKLLSKPEDFNAFFDNPANGVYRVVDRRNKPDLRTETPSGQSGFEFLKQRKEQISNLRLLARLAGSLAQAGFFGSVQDNVIVQRLIQLPEKYLYNIIFDRGMFPGLAVRNFFARNISIFLERKILQYTGGIIASSPNGGDLTFDLFYQFTGVDLVVTGTNITKHRPAVFSRRHTPRFPVAEAVAISMNLPLIFKPVYVEADVPVNRYNKSADQYRGFWVDGGVLNNLPIHAFDEFGPQVSEDYPDLRPLHPRVLGLRLTSGPNPATANSSQKDRFDVLAQYLDDVLESVLYPSEGGQIRTADEAEQTIDLFTYDLSTTEFAPPKNKREKPVKEAEKAVKKYFESSNK